MGFPAHRADPFYDTKYKALRIFYGGHRIMDTKTGPYQVVDLPKGRRVWINALGLSWPAHSMYGLLEVDVTVARRLIADVKRRTGETLSFAGFLSYCLTRAGDEE